MVRVVCEICVISVLFLCVSLFLLFFCFFFAAGHLFLKGTLYCVDKRTSNGVKPFDGGKRQIL